MSEIDDIGFKDLMSTPPDPVVPFGKHKGKYASDIPVEYLDWLLGEEWFIEKFGDLASDLARHLESRAEWHRLR